MFQAEVRWCSEKGLPHSELLSWAPEDRAKLRAWILDSTETCSSCGTGAYEWEADRNAYEAAVHQCWGCYVRESAQEDAPTMPGATVTLIPRAVAVARRAKHRAVFAGDFDD